LSQSKISDICYQFHFINNKPELKNFLSHLVDGISIFFFNLLQKPYRLPPNFPSQLCSYIESWRKASFKEYYYPDARYENKITTYIANAIDRQNQLTFPSFIRSPHSFSNYATFELYPSKRGWHQAPTMILLHGLLSLSLKGYIKWVRWLNNKGWNAVIMHLPYHFQRKPDSFSLISPSCVQPNIVHTMETLRQSVIDLYIFTKGLRLMGSPLIGAWGISYGGWIITQVACLEKTFHKLILVEPLLNIQHVIWSSPIGKEIRRKLKRLGISHSETEPHLRLACPSFSMPKVRGDNILIVGGQFDPISPPWILKKIQEKWEAKHLYILPVGHLNYTLTPESFKLASKCWKDDFSIDDH